MSEARVDSKAAKLTVEAALRQFFSDRSRGAIAAEDIDAGLHIFDAGYVDSMNSLSLLDFIEQKYGVPVSEIDLIGGLSTVAAIADYIVTRRETPSP